jgi:2,4-dienoyl-CoA reductase-like NADH-dependent reductase (Old Yellow Enzyme family)
MEFIRLFEPMTIHGLVIPNRIVMPSNGLAYTHNYALNDRYGAFYLEFECFDTGIVRSVCLYQKI